MSTSFLRVCAIGLILLGENGNRLVIQEIWRVRPIVIAQVKLVKRVLRECIARR